ncbi:MAG: alcohol dehydrogenase catalytic domain-containing protein [bacterium]
MKALVLRKPEHLELCEIPKPVPEPDEVLVRVAACGICGSDARYYYGANPWTRQTLGEDRPNPPNIILGHELAGVVVEVGARAPESLLGKRVGVLCFRGCGVCHDCRIGREQFCINTQHLGHGQGWGERDFYPGGMAEYCAVWADKAIPLPDHVSTVEASFLDPILASLHAVDVSRLVCCESVLILGAGPIGLCILQIVKALGSGHAVITDISEPILKIARDLGADEAINVSQCEGRDLVSRVRQRAGERGVDVVFNTVGTDETIEQSLAVLARGGRLILLATKSDTLHIPATALSGEKTIATSANARYADFQRSLDLLAQGSIQVKPMITHRFPLEHALDAFDIARNKERYAAIKVLIEMGS